MQSWVKVRRVEVHVILHWKSGTRENKKEVGNGSTGALTCGEGWETVFSGGLWSSHTVLYIPEQPLPASPTQPFTIMKWEDEKIHSQLDKTLSSEFCAESETVSLINKRMLLCDVKLCVCCTTMWWHNTRGNHPVTECQQRNGEEVQSCFDTEQLRVVWQQL